MEDQKTMVNDCLKRARRLTEGELGFVESLDAQLKVNLPLTERQESALDKIWDSATEAG